MKTFVLTIPRLKDRLDAFAEAWQGLDYDVFYGVDYLTLPHCGQPKLFFNIVNFLGHVNLWQHCLTFPDDSFLIIEDDQRPQVPVVKILWLIEEAKKHFWFEVLKLHSLDSVANWIGYLDDKYKLVRPLNFISCGCYYLTRPIAEHLLKNLWLCNTDKFVDLMSYNVCILPSPVKPVGVISR